MSKHSKYLLGFLAIATAWLWLLPDLQAQDVKLKATAPGKVVMGSRFELVFEFNTNQIQAFQPPNLNNFQVVAPPQQETRISSGTGQATQLKLTYTYTLSPKKAGTFTIEPAKAKIGGKIYKSESITIKVTKAPAGQNASGSQRKDLYIRLLVDKKKVYKGEAIVATFKLYSKLSIAGSNNSKEPDYNGFWTEEIEVPNMGQLRTEYINGVPFQTAVLDSRVLFPQRSGELKIDPWSIDLRVRIRQNRRRRSMFDSMFDYKEENMTIVSNGATIQVKPLPGGAPDGFDGAVGSFRFSHEIDKDSVAANEGINLKIAIRGNGNLNLVNNPALDFPPEFEVYDPKVKNRFKPTSEGVSGTKESEYLLIPRHAGRYELPAVAFSFFDPQKEQYVTLSSEASSIVVGKGSDGNGPGNVSNYSPNVKEELAVFGSDIRYIKPGPAELKEANDYFIGSAGFYTLLATPGLLFLLVLPLRRRQQLRNSDVVGQRQRKANRIANQRLSEARKAMDQGAKNAFYEAVFKALYGFVGDKLNLPVSELNKANIRENLLGKQVAESTVNELIAVLDRCEMARFAPVSDTTEQAIYDQSANIIRQLEGHLK